MPRPDFFAELKRRKVYRAGVAYLAIAFAGLQAADLVLPALGSDPRVFNGLVIATLLGFPLALAMAWMFDVGPGGVRRTGPAGESAPAAGPDRWLRLKAGLVGAGFVVVVFAGLRLWRGPAAEAAVPDARPVLAILPFDDLSSAGDRAWFADGLHEELLHQLAAFRTIRLISRTSVEHFRGYPATMAVIADSLGARYVVEGSVRATDDSVRVTVQLIDAANDEHLWSESIDRPMSVEDLFGLQQALAEGVARSLGGTLVTGRGPTGRPPTRSLEAYNLYLRGLYHWHRFTPEGVDAAEAAFRQAAAVDPEFARAHAMLALMNVILNNFGMRPSAEVFPVARREAGIAMRLAPDEPESLYALTAVHWTLDQDWDAARADLEAALSIDPDFVDARTSLAEWHGVIAGDTELGLRHIRAARLVDPFSTAVRMLEGYILYVGRRFDETAAVYRALGEDSPGDPWAPLNEALALAQIGRGAEVPALLDPVLATIPVPHRSEFAFAYARSGSIDRAREIVAAMRALHDEGGMPVPALALAVGYAGLGETEETIAWLQRCFDEEGGTYRLREVVWDGIRADPRFEALWARSGLPGPATGNPGGRIDVEG